MRKARVIDLFAGAGGLSLGFKWAGAEIIHAFEEDIWASETYKYNFPETSVVIEDVRNIPLSDIQCVSPIPPDIIVGGPPCQGFSHSNTLNKDPKDPRNSLFIDFLRFVETLQPPLCLIENVKGLLSTKNSEGQKVIDIIISSFDSIGYKAEYRILDAAEFGVPQHRERLFIVALKKIMGLTFNWPSTTHSSNENGNISLFSLLEQEPQLKSYVTLWDAISDLPQTIYGTATPEDTYISEPENDYQRLMRWGANGKLYNHEPMKHTKRIMERFSRISYGQSEEDVPMSFQPRKRGNPNIVSGVTYSQNSRRQHPDLPCNTIVAAAHTNYIHPYLHRNFTVRETLRIQSFPDTYILKGKRAVLSKKLSLRKGYLDDIYLDQRSQVGNAVPPLLTQALAESLIETLMRYHLLSEESSEVQVNAI